MQVVLNFCTGPAAGKRVVLRPSEAATLGRGRGSSVMVPEDRLLSGTHFRVVCSLKECIIEDLDSRNGTALNGIRISRAVLADGDRISPRSFYLVEGEISVVQHLLGCQS